MHITTVPSTKIDQLSSLVVQEIPCMEVVLRSLTIKWQIQPGRDVNNLSKNKHQLEWQILNNSVFAFNRTFLSRE